MKRILLTIAIAMIMISCEEPGTTRMCIRGDERTLPDELKGLKVYQVCMPGGGSINVAVLNGQATALDYREGKHDESVIMLLDKHGLVIPISDVILENDSVIVARKRK